MLLPVRLWPDPILKQSAAEVGAAEFGTDELNKLLDDMFETMKVEDGIGLAAPQIGVSKRILVLVNFLDKHPDSTQRPWEIINPEVIEVGENGKEDNEGCLSLEGMSFRKRRPVWVKFGYHDRCGQRHEEIWEGFRAQVFFHEIDHLDGILLIDPMVERYEKKQAYKLKEWADRIQENYRKKVERRSIYHEKKRNLMSSQARTAFLAASILGSGT
jgi:peptide deformylase